MYLFYFFFEKGKIFKIKKAANQVRMLADQTLRAIQPINCSGPKCPSSMIPVNSMVPAIQEIDMMVPNMRQSSMTSMYDAPFSFKEINSNIRNLRRN